MRISRNPSQPVIQGGEREAHVGFMLAGRASWIRAESFAPAAVRAATTFNDYWIGSKLACYTVFVQFIK